MFYGGKSILSMRSSAASASAAFAAPALFSLAISRNMRFASGSIAPNSAIGGDMNVVVNVDASGTEVQGNQGNADQLGRLIGQAVQAELIKQKRPGGLLTR